MRHYAAPIDPPEARGGEAAIVLVDARELPAHEGPANPGLRAGRPAAVEEIGGCVPKKGTGVEPPHQRERQDNRVVAQVLMEGRVEDDPIALEVRGEKRE